MPRCLVAYARGDVPRVRVLGAAVERLAEEVLYASKIMLQ
jgi:hypothetical protein